MKTQFEKEVLSQIYGSDDQFFIKVLSVLTETLKKYDNKIDPNVIMDTISSILDIMIPKLNLPAPQFLTRKIAKRIILNAIKPIIHGEK